MAGIFDSGIFKAGTFDQAASSSCIFDTGIFDQGIFDHCPDAVAQQPAAGGQWRDWLPRRPDVSQEDTPELKPKRKKRKRVKADTIDLAPDGPVEVQTGIVETVPAWDALVELQRIQNEAAEARRQRLRAIALADDEWLMMQ